MALTFDREFDPAYGEAVKVGPGVRRVTAQNPGPFTFRGTNTFLIGESELAVLDPGPDDSRHRDTLVRAIGDARIRYILVSHAHSDHAPGARPLQAAAGGQILAAAPRRAALAPAEAGMLDAADDPHFSPDQALDDGAVVEGRDYRLEVIATPGHDPGHLAFALTGRDLLFSGDHVMGWATTVVAPPDGSMRDYMASLDRLLERPESLYLPAHGGAIYNARDYVRALKTHRLMRERAILERLAAGDRAISEMVARIYRDIDPRLHGAAALSTLAHLQDLVARKLVLADGPLSLGTRYWLEGTSEPSGSGSSVAATGGARDTAAS